VVTEILDQTSKKDIGEIIADRAKRGRDLYLRRRQLITRTGEDTYTVPGSRGRYEVRYGDKVESCECVDFGVHCGELACKHLVAVALFYASRRGSTGVKVRTISTAGDPFEAADKARQRRLRLLASVLADGCDRCGVDEAGFGHDAELCESCATELGVL
jgi:hypothetical protein